MRESQGKMNVSSKPSWKLRRRAVFGSMLFAMAVIVYVLVRWDDTSLAQTLILSSFALIGTVVAAYISGAAYEDVKIYQTDTELLSNTNGELNV
jgi:multisubunit Na+/H+ antiporter MnhG subunit